MSESSVTPGYCQCGCGEYVGFWPRTDTAKGRIKGKPRKYVLGHQKRVLGLPYIIDEDSGCWVWQRSIGHTGYGYAWVRGGNRHIVAHRLYYELYKGPVPDNLDLDHLCRNRACVNPEHLEPVSGPENIRRGNSTKLNWIAVRDIRNSFARGKATKRQLAQRHQVGIGTVREILRGDTWRELGETYINRNKRTRLTDKQKREVGKRKNNGESARFLAREFGIAYCTVYTYANQRHD